MLACPAETAIIENPEKSTGFLLEASAYGAPQEAARECPVPPAWVSDELLARTREVWSAAYGRPVGEEEAVEMLVNVKRLICTTMRAMGYEGGEG